MTRLIVSFLEKKLNTYLDELRTLVSIDSGSQHKAGVDAINDWLEDRLLGLDFQVERFRQEEFGDDILALRHGEGQGRILLLGHSDTVFPVGTAAERPMRIRGDKVLGPGTCDMKAGLLTGIYALEALREIGYGNFGTIAYLCVSDEESPQRHAIPLIRSESGKADVVLTLEAARENGDIVTARKAIRWYTIEAFGRSAHAGVEPEKGRSAILALAHHTVALDLKGLHFRARRNEVSFGDGVGEGVSEADLANRPAGAFNHPESADLDVADRSTLGGGADGLHDRCCQDYLPGDRHLGKIFRQEDGETAGRNEPFK